MFRELVLWRRLPVFGRKQTDRQTHRQTDWMTFDPWLEIHLEGGKEQEKQTEIESTKFLHNFYKKRESQSFQMSEEPLLL